MSDKKFYINGKWVSPKSNKSIKVINPATEDVCAEISLGSKKMLMMQFCLQKKLSKHGLSSKKRKIRTIREII